MYLVTRTPRGPRSLQGTNELLPGRRTGGEKGARWGKEIDDHRRVKGIKLDVDGMPMGVVAWEAVVATLEGTCAPVPECRVLRTRSCGKSLYLPEG
eukprot:scaffold14874_cov66-Attheya_sp.AAC.2